MVCSERTPLGTEKLKKKARDNSASSDRNAQTRRPSPRARRKPLHLAQEFFGASPHPRESRLGGPRESCARTASRVEKLINVIIGRRPSGGLRRKNSSPGKRAKVRALFGVLVNHFQPICTWKRHHASVHAGTLHPDCEWQSEAGDFPGPPPLQHLPSGRGCWLLWFTPR